MNDDCVITIEMDYKKDTKDCSDTVGVLGAGNHPCSKQINGYLREHYRRGQAWKPHVIWNVTNGDTTHYGKATVNVFKLHLKAVTSLSKYKFWNGYDIADIEVSINNYLSNHRLLSLI